MRVVVTGGAGFIGANLCQALTADPDTEVVAFDDLSTGDKSNLAGISRVRLIEASVLDARALQEALAGTDAVVHLAARPSVPRSLTDPTRSHDVNTTGTLRVLEAVRQTGNPHLIVASSSSVYGRNPTLPKHEDLATAPMSPYAATKLATESYALAWGSSFGLDVLAFRFFNVFGPLQPAGHAYAAVIPAFVSAALAGEPLPVDSDGGQTRDFTYVESVTAVIADAVRRRVTCEGPVNLAFGGRSSLSEVIALLGGILGRELPCTHRPPRAGDIRDSQADQTRLRELFPSVHPIALEDGLRRTVAWFRSSAGAPVGLG